MESAYLFPLEHPYRHLHVPAIIIAGFFVFLALSLSLFLTFQHLRSYNNPAEQKWIVAVIFMVPAYATESIISLWNPKLSLACDILRSCYEAFALYAFGSYLIECLGGELRVLDFLEDEAKKQISKPLLEGKKEFPTGTESVLQLCLPTTCAWERPIHNHKIWSCTIYDFEDSMCIVDYCSRAMWCVW